MIPMNLGRLASCLLLGTTAWAQTPTTVVRQGDTVIGVGAVRAVEGVLINDRGTWFANIATTFPSADSDQLLLRTGLVTLREGSPLFAPAGSAVGGFHSSWTNDAGDLALILDLQGTSTSTDQGLFWNTILIAQRGTPAGIPGLEDRLWNGFTTVKMNASNTLLVLAKTSTAGATGFGDDALVRFELDGTGSVSSATVLAAKGQFIPALGEELKNIGMTPHLVSLNERGDFLSLIKPTVSGAAYLLNLKTIVAQEGFPAPVPDRIWNSLANNPHTCLNDFGDYVVTGSLDGEENTYLIVKNGEKFVQEGDLLPSLAPARIGADTPPPVYVANSGDVYWYTGTDTGDDEAFMRNHDVILRSRLTHVGELTVRSLISNENAFHVSRDGRFFIGLVSFGNGVQAALLVDFGLVVPIPGCQGNPGRLFLRSGMALPGDHLEFALDDGQASGALPILVLSSRPLLSPAGCGRSTPFGEVLISAGQRVGSFVFPAWNGSASTRAFDVPPERTLVDQTFYAQGFFLDPASATERIRLTNALKIEFGAP